MNAAKLLWRLNRGRRARLAASLVDVSHRLGELARSTEQDFLAVGEKLEEIAGRARSDAGTLSGLTGDMGGEREQNLAEVLEEVTAWAEQASRGGGSTELLAGLERVVTSVCAPLDALNHSVRSLRVMGVMTRVETARVGAAAAGFEALAVEVSGLADAINEKSGAIADAVRSLSRLLNGTREEMAWLERTQQSELLRLLAECSAGVGDVRAEQDRIRSISLAAQEGYRKVSTGIADIVVALQFHDGTRQRLEHVEAALAEVAGGLAEGTTGAALVAHSVELQEAQLSEARESFLEGVVKIRADLASFAETVRTFAAMANDLAGSDADREQAIGARVERHFTRVGSAVADWIASRRTVADAANDVDEACQRMSGFVSEIELIAEHLLRLALNAEIQAVRLADAGAVMEAVAEGIRATSTQASEIAGSVGAALRQVEDAAGSLGIAVNDTHGAAGETAGIVSRLNGIASELRARGGERRRVLGSIAASGDALAQSIAALQSGITADEITSSVARSCLDELERVIETCGAEPMTAAEQAASIEQVRAKYTMHAEREVHDSFAGVAAPELEVAVVQGGSEYGDNVELF